MFGSTLFSDDPNSGRVSIDAVFDQLFHDRGGAFDDFAGRNPFDSDRIELADFGIGHGWIQGR